MDRKTNCIIFHLALGAMLLSGCMPYHSGQPPIATPGSIDAVGGKIWVPPILEWRYEDHMLVHTPGSSDGWMGPGLFSWDWRKDELTEIQLAKAPFGRLDAVESPKDRSLIAYSMGGDIYLLNLLTHQEEIIAKGSALDFSPDGGRLAYQDGRDLKIYDLDQRQELGSVYTWSIENPADYIAIYELRWNPDGTRIAYNKILNHPDNIGENWIAYIDMTTYQEHIIEEGRYIVSLSWSPDGRLLAYERDSFQDRSALVIVEPVQNCIVEVYPIPELTGSAFWSPDGEVILIERLREHYFLNVEKVFGKPYSDLGCGR